MQDILLGVKEHLDIIITLLLGTGIVSYLYYKFRMQVVPMLIKRVAKLFLILVSNLFGKSVSGEEDLTESLPFVEEFDLLRDDIIRTVELKLFELRQKLASPIYTDEEKVPIRKMYDYIYKNYSDKISEEAKEILKAFDAPVA